MKIITDFLGKVTLKGKINLYNAERIFYIIDNNLRNKKYFGKVIAGKVDGKIKIKNF